jgi:hypothetical protein
MVNLAEIRARWASAQKPPWEWFTNQKSVLLQQNRGKGHVVIRKASHGD